MNEAGEVWNKLLALCDQALDKVERGFVEMPGVIQETCSGNGFRPCGSSARKSTKSSQTTVAGASVNKSESVVTGATVNKKESVVSQKSISEKSNVSNVDGKLHSVVFSSTDKKQLLYAHFFDSEKPIEDEAMRKLEKDLGC